MLGEDTFVVGSEGGDYDEAMRLIESIKDNIREGNDYGTEWEALMQIKESVSDKISPYFQEEPAYPRPAGYQDTKKMSEYFLQKRIERFLENDFPLLNASKMRGQSEQIKQLQSQVVQMQGDQKLRDQQQSELIATMQLQFDKMKRDLDALTNPHASAPEPGIHRHWRGAF